ncbi:MAG: type II secretion system protein [Deltaproteobacteria bacterium]|nr:type II secretion system protein [Deltaproteobacteria bacterium]
MKNQTGFTLVELMVVIAIVGILFVTAIPVYQTWQQRAYGQEATLMAKQIIDGQIMYYLDNDDFFPAVGDDFEIREDNPPADQTQRLQDIEEHLKITIPVGHNLIYEFDNKGEIAGFMLTVRANFPLFKDGKNGLYSYVNPQGEITIFAVVIPM